MTIIQNTPCQKCSPSENKKHCFSCNSCLTEYNKPITFLGKESGLCSQKWCEDNFLIIWENSKYLKCNTIG